MSSKRLWDLLARKYNNELTAEEEVELEQLLREHRDVFELNETFSRLRDMPLQRLSTTADEERSRQAIAARLAALQEENLDTPVEDIFPFRPRPIKKIMLWAAACCALVIIGLAVYQLTPGRQIAIAPVKEN